MAPNQSLPVFWHCWIEVTGVSFYAIVAKLGMPRVGRLLRMLKGACDELDNTVSTGCDDSRFSIVGWRGAFRFEFV